MVSVLICGTTMLKIQLAAWERSGRDKNRNDVEMQNSERLLEQTQPRCDVWSVAAVQAGSRRNPSEIPVTDGRDQGVSLSWNEDCLS
jgi:hypothetical protein